MRNCERSCVVSKLKTLLLSEDLVETLVLAAEECALVVLTSEVFPLTRRKYEVGFVLCG